MKILQDLFYRSNKLDSSHFFIFANTEYSESTEKKLWKSSAFLSQQSICVLFNLAKPLNYYDIVNKHTNKWIFFRLLANKDNDINFRNLDLIDLYDFKKFFLIPDIYDPIYFGPKKQAMLDTLSYIKEKRIDITKMNHMDINDNKALSSLKDHYPLTDNKGTMSSGLWVYIYLRTKYPLSRITLIDYALNMNSIYHNSVFEQGFMLSEILNKRCEYIGDYL